MEWLEQNLELAYPFADSVTDAALAHLFADALVSGRSPGACSLTIFDPQAISNGHVQIMADSTVIYDVVGMTSTIMGAYTVLQGVDNARGSHFRFIVSTAKLTTYALLTSPALFAPQVCNLASDRVTSLQGLTGEVTIEFDKFVSAALEDGRTTLTAEDPIDRVECSGLPTEILTINGVQPDERGSFILDSDGCYRLVPNPDVPGQLLLMNFCTPCLSTTLMQAINTRIGQQADYFHQLGAINQDQFNRYQQLVAKKNAQLDSINGRAARAGVGTAGAGSSTTGITPDSVIDITGRAFDRPYFTQLALGLVNSSPYRISIALTVTIGALSAYVTAVPGSGTIHRFLQSGKIHDTFPPFPGNAPGTLTVALDQRDVVSLSSELHLNKVEATSPKAGQWLVSAVVTFLGGPGALPSPFTIVKAFDFQVLTAEFTTPPVKP